MQSERKQEIVKAKLKKARQQLNTQTSSPQVQVGGGTPVASPAQVVAAPVGPIAVTPLLANVLQKAPVGRPARVAKPKPSPPAAAVASKKTTPPKPPVTRSKTRNQLAPANIVVTAPENDTAAPVDAEYDTDELAKLPTDSEPEAVESEPGEENV